MNPDNLIEDLKSLAEQYDGECPVCGLNHRKQYETIMKYGVTTGHAMDLMEHNLWALRRESWPLSDFGQPEISDAVFE